MAAVAAGVGVVSMAAVAEDSVAAWVAEAFAAASAVEVFEAVMVGGDMGTVMASGADGEMGLASG